VHSASVLDRPFFAVCREILCLERREKERGRDARVKGTRGRGECKNSPSAGIISLTSSNSPNASACPSNYARSTSSFSDTLISAGYRKSFKVECSAARASKHVYPVSVRRFRASGGNLRVNRSRARFLRATLTSRRNFAVGTWREIENEAPFFPTRDCLSASRQFVEIPRDSSRCRSRFGETPRATWRQSGSN